MKRWIVFMGWLSAGFCWMTGAIRLSSPTPALGGLFIVWGFIVMPSLWKWTAHQWGMKRSLLIRAIVFCASLVVAALLMPQSANPAGTGTPARDILAAAPTAARPNLPACVKQDCDCADFSSRAEAEQVFRAFPDDPFDLDRDLDGIPCETLK